MIPTTRMSYADGVAQLRNRYSMCLMSAMTSSYHCSGTSIAQPLTKVSQLAPSAQIS